MGERAGTERPSRQTRPSRERRRCMESRLARASGRHSPQGSSTAATDGNNGLVAPAYERGHVSRWSGQVGEMLVASAAM